MANHKVLSLSNTERDFSKRPLRLMHETLRDIKDFDRKASRMRAEVEDDKSVPRWCFAPMSRWAKLHASAHPAPLNPNLRDLLQHLKMMQHLSAVGPWRYTQGVYVFDEPLLNSLCATELSRDLPVDVLTRLPEWSIYVALPAHAGRDNVILNSSAMRGFFVHLEHGAQNAQNGVELRFLLDMQTGLLPWILHLGPWTVAEAVGRTQAVAAKYSPQKAGLGGAPVIAEMVKHRIQTSQWLLSLVLYLCSEQPEIVNDREHSAAPCNPLPKVTKFGRNLVPPLSPRIWHVGREIGRKIREASVGAGQVHTGRAPIRTHIRSGHWNLYWTGPRSGPQTAFYHWLPPTPVSSRHKEAA
jgi:hypothetical protein